MNLVALGLGQAVGLEQGAILAAVVALGLGQAVGREVEDGIVVFCVLPGRPKTPRPARVNLVALGLGQAVGREQGAILAAVVVRGLERAPELGAATIPVMEVAAALAVAPAMVETAAVMVETRALAPRYLAVMEWFRLRFVWLAADVWENPSGTPTELFRPLLTVLRAVARGVNRRLVEMGVEIWVANLRGTTCGEMVAKVGAEPSKSDKPSPVPSV